MLENMAPKLSKKPIKIIGCGLAGAEAAFILANNGFMVHIFDNKQNLSVESFDYYDKYETYLTENMKYELECLGSPLLSLSKRLAFNNFGFVYDENFMKSVHDELEKHPNIHIFKADIDTLTESETTIIATGHNTKKSLIENLEQYIGKMHVCYFQPQKTVISAKSVKKENIYQKSECVFYANLQENEYMNLYQKIRSMDKKDTLTDEKEITIESLARRGEQGLRNSCLRPHFAGEYRAYASIKITYNKKHDAFVLDDFVSNLSDTDLLDVLKTIETFKDVEVLQYGKIKRKTYLLAPACLNEKMQIQSHENFYVCGGFCGTAGSFESLLMANLCAYSLICEQKGLSVCRFLLQNTCISKIIENLLKKSVINFRLINFKYDIIDLNDLDELNLKNEILKLKENSKTQIDKFKERFYGKYF